MQTEVNKEGTGAHPHRGIATLSYILNGEDEHFDSAGNYAMVHSGGVQWMNAGNGIIHDETLNHDSQTDSKLVHGFQFWINLPSAIKAEKPAYISVEGNEVPVKLLPEGKGWIKVIVVSYEELHSLIPDFTEQFLYHIRLEPGVGFAVGFQDQTEVAAYLPGMPAIINDLPYNAGDFIEFDRVGGTIELRNENREAGDFLLFGGARYQEPIFAEGPFVMNSKVDTAIAYRDFYNGDYGKIDYEKQRSADTGK
jgi:redox-sensitive bicupin YhaK (pirin superfamily)